MTGFDITLPYGGKLDVPDDVLNALYGVRDFMDAAYGEAEKKGKPSRLMRAVLDEVQGHAMSLMRLIDEGKFSSNDYYTLRDIAAKERVDFDTRMLENANKYPVENWTIDDKGVMVPRIKPE